MGNIQCLYLPSNGEISRISDREARIALPDLSEQTISSLSMKKTIDKPPEQTLYLFPITEIESMILFYLKISDYKNLIMINKYFKKIIYNDEIYLQFRKFFRKHESLCVKPDRIYKSHDIMFMRACIYGYLTVAEYLYHKFKPDINTATDYTFTMSCANGHIETSKFVLSINNKIDIHKNKEEAFRLSCANGHIEVIKFLFSLDSNINIHIGKEYAFIESCKNGHTDVVKFLLSVDDKIDIHANRDEALMWTCFHKHTDLIKILISLDEPKNFQKLNHIFQQCCYYGNIDIVKLLISLDIGIDIHSNEEAAFRESCRMDNLKLAQYLYSLDGKIDIHAKNDEAYCNSYDRGNHKTSKWLQSLFDI